MEVTLILRSAFTKNLWLWTELEKKSVQDAVDHYMLVSGLLAPIGWIAGINTQFTDQALRAEMLELAVKEGRTISWVAGRYIVDRGPVSFEELRNAPAAIVGPLNGPIVGPNTPSAPAADPSITRDANHHPLPVQGRTPFDPFKDFVVTGSRVMKPKTNGREFGSFASPDTQSTSHQVDPTFASAAERNAK